MRFPLIRVSWVCLLATFFCSIHGAGCSARPASDGPTLTLATTTSAQDTGLLDELLPRFRDETGIEVKVVARGTGEALQLARRGDADALLVHDPASEEQLIADGFGEARHEIMHNDFVLVGPANDPAGVKGEKSIAAAFATIAAKEAAFYSRGDKSGTHQKEKAVWRAAHIEPNGAWYRSSGVGMAEMLSMADEKQGYTLTDRGTFLKRRKHLELVILSEGDPLLFNRYSVIVVNPDKHPHVHHAEAVRFLTFMQSPATRNFIAEFGVERYGAPLFYVNEINP